MPFILLPNEISAKVGHSHCEEKPNKAFTSNSQRVVLWVRMRVLNDRRQWIFFLCSPLEPPRTNGTAISDVYFVDKRSLLAALFCSADVIFEIILTLFVEPRLKRRNRNVGHTECYAEGKYWLVTCSALAPRLMIITQPRNSHGSISGAFSKG